MKDLEMENMFRKLQEYLDEHSNSDKEDDELVLEFIGKHNMEIVDSEHENEYELDEKNMTKKEKAILRFEMATNAESDSEAKELVKEALKLDPNLIDAMVFQSMVEDSPKVSFNILYKALAKEKKSLEKDGIWEEENIGDFWGIWETRPYMRVLYALLELYKANYMFSKAIEIGNEVLRLNEGDNMGVRFSLASIYAVIEDEENLLKLLEKFKIDESISFMLPYIVFLVKTGKEKEALKIYKKLQRNFPGFNDILEEDSTILLGELEIFAEFNMGGYRYGSEEEFIKTCYTIGTEVFMNSSYLYEWLYENKVKAKKTTTK